MVTCFGMWGDQVSVLQSIPFVTTLFRTYIKMIKVGIGNRNGNRN